MFKRTEGDDRAFAGAEPGEIREGRPDASDVTVVGQGARLEGNLVSAGSLRIDGEVKGTIRAEGDVMLSPSSRVEADIDATNVLVAGAFKGTIVVRGKAELARGGRVDGNVTSATLVVAEGAVFSGQSIMEQPTRKGASRETASVRPPAGAQAAGGGMPGEGAAVSDQGEKTPVVP